MLNIYTNVLKMCEYRKIKIKKKSDINKVSDLDLLEIDGSYNNEAFKCYVVAQNSDILGKKSAFTPIYNAVISIKEATNVMIIGYEPASAVKKMLDELNHLENVYLEVLTTNPFIVEVPKHILSVPHSIVLGEEREALEQELRGYTLPKIQRTDPMAIWIGARSNDIVKITRLSEIGGEITAYRKVI